MTAGDHVAAALDLAAHGTRVFPAKPTDKSPLTPRGFHDATTDEATIRGWWERWPQAMIGTPTGDGWFVLDADDPAALAALEAEHGPLPPTREVITPRPGRHLYFNTTAEVGNARGALPSGIDCRGKGGYVIAPPSVNGNGAYEWRNLDLEIAPAPAWLLDVLGAGKTSNGHAPPVEGAIPANERNNTLTSLAGTMRRRGFHEAAIAAALLVTNRDRCKPPLSDREVRGIAHSVARYRPATGSAVDQLEELSALIGLTEVGKRIDTVRVYGRGSRAHVYLLLDDASRVVLDPLGACAAPMKLTIELASQAGARPALKAPDVARVVQLIYVLGEHFESGEVADRAWELGAGYLRGSVIAEVVMSDQASRWAAFAALERADRSDVVLLDATTGERYVRTQWLAEHLRAHSAPGEPDRMLHELERSGWTKPGTEGRIKATRPGFKETLQWAFYVVSTGWEDR